MCKINNFSYSNKMTSLVKILLLTGGQLLWSGLTIMLVSAIQQHKSIVTMHMSSPSWTSPPILTPTHLSRLSQFLCYTAISHSYLFYIQHCIRFNAIFSICLTLSFPQATLVAQLVKNPPAMWETWVWSLRWEDPLEKGKVTHSSILAWRIPLTV